MKRSSLWMTLGVLSLAAACGSNPVQKYGTAVSAPTGTVTKAGMESGIASSSKAQSTAGRINPTAGILKTGSSAGDLANAIAWASYAGDTSTVNLLSGVHSGLSGAETSTDINPFETICKNPQLQNQSGSGTSPELPNACKYSASVEFKCLSNNEVAQVRTSITIDCTNSTTEELKGAKVTYSAFIKVGKYQGGFGWFAIFDGEITYKADANGEPSSTGTLKTVKVAFGGGYYHDSASKYVGAAVLFVDDKSYVFFTLNDESTGGLGSASAVMGQTLCLKGANGSFAIRCQEGNDDAVKCALWKSGADGTLTLESSTIDPAPETPTEASCSTNGLLKTLGDFVNL